MSCNTARGKGQTTTIWSREPKANEITRLNRAAAFPVKLPRSVPTPERIHRCTESHGVTRLWQRYRTMTWRHLRRREGVASRFESS